ncbi:MAG TPA: menaquinone-dependent protoporphyrinogen IX dehydrogenase [Burkholderiales bacterium]|nr:menaquinone-dependent protoporphyrinogen IX dehydrogenase [Burkholderiales bacterium]
MAKILILYATVEGQTARIASRLGQHLLAAGHSVQAVQAHPGSPIPSLAAYEAVLVGASVHYGHHPGFLAGALKRQRDTLRSRPCAFFSVSLSADGPGAKPEAAGRYARTFLRRIGWQPHQTATFGGALRYTQYPAWKRWLVGLFVRVAGGDTDQSRDYEYTDWRAVEQFAHAFDRSLVRA